ncbi:MAG: hypothetical protein WCF84_17515 [Anaerolineae bacterium]
MIKNQSRWPHWITRRWALDLSLAFAVLVLYLAWPSQQRSWDGAIQTALDVTQGHVVVNMRHILYAVAGVPYYAAWKELGYQGDATWPLQVLNALLGAGGIVFLAELFTRMARSRWVGMLLALGLAFSYGYWYFVAETWYNIMALFFLVGAAGLFFALQAAPRENEPAPRTQQLYVIGIAVAVALAIIADLEHVVSAGVLGLAILFLLTRLDLRRRIQLAVWYGVTLTALLVAGVVGFGVVLARNDSLPALLTWLQPKYLVDDAPMYGAFSLERIPLALTNLGAAILPIERGMRLRLLLSGTFSADRLIGQVSLGALALILALALFWWIRYVIQVWTARSHRPPWRFRRSAAGQGDSQSTVTDNHNVRAPIDTQGANAPQGRGRLLLLCLAWVVLIGTFAVWQDPYSLKRWLPAFIPFGILLCIPFGDLVAEWRWPRAQALGALGILGVASILAANLSLAIGPDHNQPNMAFVQGMCTAQHMGKEDLIISSGWDGYTRYLFLENRKAVQLLELSAALFGKTPDGPGLAREMDRIIAEARQKGERVWMTDIFNMDADQWKVVTANTGLTPANLSKYEREIGWNCQGAIVWEIKGP